MSFTNTLPYLNYIEIYVKFNSDSVPAALLLFNNPLKGPD